MLHGRWSLAILAGNQTTMAVKNYLLTVLLLLFMIPSHAQVDPNLAYYKKANAQLAPPAKNEIRVVFMGNSITEGWEQQSLSLFKDPSNINRGISGQTTPQMKGRFYDDVIALQPKAVVILAGINDIAQNTGPISIEEIAANINAMAQMAYSHDITVFVCSVLPANHFPWRPEIKPAELVVSLNTLLKAIVLEQQESGHQIEWVNYYDEMVNQQLGLQEQYTYDGVHCTAKGYQAMETIIKRSLDKLK